MVSVKSKIYYEMLEKAWDVLEMENRCKIRISGHFLILKTIDRTQIQDQICMHLDQLPKG